MSDLLIVENLTITFPSPGGEIKAVNNLSFSLKKGETLALIGESGAGKSVTGKALIGYNRKFWRRGLIILNGKNITTLPEKKWGEIRGKEIGFLPQEAASCLNPTRPVGKQIAETIQKHCRLPFKPAKEKACWLLEQVGLARPKEYFSAYPHQLSGGLRQQVLLAIVLSGYPRILIADEPTTGLDIIAQAYIIKILESLKKNFRLTILLITHNFNIASFLADRALIIHEGQKVNEGTTNEIFQGVLGIDQLYVGN